MQKPQTLRTLRTVLIDEVIENEAAISSRFLVPPRRGSPQHARKSHDVRLVFWAPPIPGSEAAFIQGLKVAVFVEGDNISIEQRWVSRCHARIVTHLNVEERDGPLM